jgi:putative iron-regulated protein
MKRLPLRVVNLMIGFTICACTLSGCKKDKGDDIIDQSALEQQVLDDFVRIVAIPQYAALHADADSLQQTVRTFIQSPSDRLLQEARNRWRLLRQTWEQCEGFLLGPVEDDEYDPQMDTWPVDFVQMDSLLASDEPLTLQTLQQLDLSLRGFHPVEYLLWGKDGNKTAADFTDRQQQYLSALVADLEQNTAQLYQSWISEGGNFAATVLKAGQGSNRYLSRLEALQAITGAVAGICDEVGNGKIAEPFTRRDSLITESPFSHNSMQDFMNNIIGAQQVYLGDYGGVQGKGLTDLVALHNVALDNRIRHQFILAIQSLQQVTLPFEQAIYMQRTQLSRAMEALSNLENTLSGALQDYLQQYVKD